MAKVFASFPGKVLIGNYGVAYDDEPVTVPEEIAAELEKSSKVRVERDEPQPPPKRVKKGKED